MTKRKRWIWILVGISILMLSILICVYLLLPNQHIVQQVTLTPAVP